MLIGVLIGCGQIYQITQDNGALWLNVGYLEVPERDYVFRFPIFFGISLLFIFYKKLSGNMVQVFLQKIVLVLAMKNGFFISKIAKNILLT
jgi:hypothetical protein